MRVIFWLLSWPSYSTSHPCGKSLMSCWINNCLFNVPLSPSYCDYLNPSQLSCFDYCISYVIDFPTSTCCEIIFWCICGVLTSPFFHDVTSIRKLHERKELRVGTPGGQYYYIVFHFYHILLKHIYSCANDYYFWCP